MEKIVIPVGVDRPEDDILELTDLLGKAFRGRVTVASALIIETDVPEIAALIRAMPGTTTEYSAKPAAKKPATCLDCGKSVTKPNTRCKSCAMKARRQEQQA